MQNLEFFNKLAIPKPWKIQQVSQDQQRKAIIIRLSCYAKRRGWFNSVQDITCPICGEMAELPTESQYIMVRHINVDEILTYLQIPIVQIDCVRLHNDCPMRLYNSPHIPYSKLMEQQIRNFQTAPNGIDAATIALKLNSNELEQCIEYGWLVRKNSLPPLSHPVWKDLINQRVSLKTQNLGLQCLLTWAHKQLQHEAISEAERLSKIGMVRGYFEKYRSVLKGELDQVLNAGGLL